MEQEQALPEGTLKKLDPLRQLDTKHLQLMQSKMHRSRLTKGQKIVGADSRNWLVYLLSGDMGLLNSGKKESEVHSGSPRCNTPIFKDGIANQSALARSPCEILKVDRNYLENLLREISASQMNVHEYEMGDDDQIVVEEVINDYKKGKIRVPNMPVVAFKLCQEAKKNDASLDEIARIIQNDPAISGKIIAASNSVLIRGSHTVTKVKDAILRLGLKQTKNLVMSLAMLELFQGNDPSIMVHLERLWHLSVDVSCHCFYICKSYKILDPSDAQIAGLLHDIGSVTVLGYFESQNIGMSTESLEASLARLRNLIGLLVVEKWEMSQDICKVVEYSNIWNFDADDSIEYVDVVNLALAHIYNAENAQMLVNIESLPIAKKLDLGEITGDGILCRLEQEKELIDAMRSLLIS